MHRIAPVKPGPVIVERLRQLDFGIGVIQGRPHCVGYVPLQGQLAVETLALVLGAPVLQLLRNRQHVARADRWTVYLVCIVRHSPPHDIGLSPIATLHVGTRGIPAVHGRRFETIVTFLIYGRQGDADLIVSKVIDVNAGNLRRKFVAGIRRRVIYSLQTEVQDSGINFKWLRGLDIDRGTDAAGGYIGTARFVHFYARNSLGRQVGKIERAGAFKTGS